MTLSYSDTKRLIELVINESFTNARSALKLELINIGRTEPEFCAGVIKHGPHMKYTSDQWFDFFTKIPNLLFQYERDLLNKLTPKQRSLLKFD